MSAHLRRRGKYFYIIDGPYMRSTKSSVKRYAEAELKRYNDGHYSVGRIPTVQERYTEWIEEVSLTARRSRIRDYKQAFAAYVLPRFKHTPITEIDTGAVIDFKNALIRSGKKEKWVRNIVDCSFRAFFRDSRAKVKAIQGRDPFIDVTWERIEYDPPEPFTAEERDQILMHFGEHEPWYYPFVRFQFDTGARPSEAVALTWGDLNPGTLTVRINKSRHLGSEGIPKTPKSRRTIIVSAGLMELLQASRLPIWNDSDKVFHNKKGTALTSDYFRKDYWTPFLEALKVRKLKLYATRHTFITERVKAGENLLAIAQYAGTSLAMIQSNYCGSLGLQTKIEQAGGVRVADTNFINAVGVASPTGFEPVLSA
jgi:integrase